MLTIEEALELVQDRWKSINSPGTIRKKNSYIKRFRAIAKEKGFQYPCQEIYDIFMQFAEDSCSQNVITNHYSLVRTMDEVAETNAIDRHGRPYNDTFRFPDREKTMEYFKDPVFPLKDGEIDIRYLCSYTCIVLEGFNLSSSTLYQYMLGYRRFIEYCKKKGKEVLFRCHAKDYLLQLANEFTDHGNWRYKIYRRSVLVLLEVVENGDFKWKMFHHKPETVQTGLVHISDMVCREMEERNVSPATVSLYRYVFRLMSEAIGAEVEEDISGMEKDEIGIILNAFSKRFSPRSLNTIQGIFRNILTILNELGILESDYSRMVLPRNNMEDHIHTILTKEESDVVANDLQRMSARNRAIILLALDLGLRDSDICELSFENIDWHNDRIRLIQRKTGVALDLPLLDEVGNAIYEYITNERPHEAACRQIFVRQQAPYMKLGSVYSIVSKMLNRLELCKEKPKGPHILRRTMVARLLHAEVPHQVITDVLGHVASDSDKEYYSMETERLRMCSLPLPRVAGEVHNG